LVVGGQHRLSAGSRVEIVSNEPAPGT
jgi:hypothetical protein